MPRNRLQTSKRLHSAFHRSLPPPHFRSLSRYSAQDGRHNHPRPLRASAHATRSGARRPPARLRDRFGLDCPVVTLLAAGSAMKTWPPVGAFLEPDPTAHFEHSSREISGPKAVLFVKRCLPQQNERKICESTESAGPGPWSWTAINRRLHPCRGPRPVTVEPAGEFARVGNKVDHATVTSRDRP